MKKLTVIILSLILLTGCSISVNNLKINIPTNQEILQAKEDFQNAREEINLQDDITFYEKKVSNWAIDFAEKVSIDFAEYLLDNNTKGDD